MAIKKSIKQTKLNDFDFTLDLLYSKLNADEREALKRRLLPEAVSRLLDDSELVDSLEALFDKSLNISEASRATFVHRNTLVYRLNKMKESTGRDFSNFEDAAYMRMCMWLKNKEKQDEPEK